ncbi:SPOR domain-containing protein [Denitrobaculum tricleocarpae]|uniref:SPOR domain-containing protein n=1 Tax=Denitrobaculum tricleocarpae TaxID=2591009 RepID=A0A545TQ03_9PROT|nr:SPOR domain-containing protein [Denitrobaculum tricleocarpae]TQV79304.1 hypothetical protein FKG95_16790 [Denitrobaculum tricleocarpae]
MTARPLVAGEGLDSGRNSGYDPGYDQGIEMDDFVQDTGDDERDQRRRSHLMPVGIALVILAAFGGVVWFAFLDPGTSPDREQTVELIQADPEPVKTKPENPGGMQVEHQDKLILNPDPEKPQVERLLPPPEAPLPLASSNSATNTDNALANNEDRPVVVTEEADAGSPSLLNDDAKTLAEQAETAVTSGAGSGTAGTSAASTVGNASVDKPKTEAEKAAETPSAAPTIPDAPAVKPTPVAPVAAEAPKPAARPEPAAPKPAATQLAEVPRDSGYVLQLASLRSEDLALTEWQRIQNANKGLLAQMKAIVERAEIDGIGTRYRLQTGPFPTKATAQDLCAQLKAAKQDCLVKRR